MSTGWGRQERERSPRGGGGKDKGWISRTIAGFGRYKDKRPAGLQLDAKGALKLDSLVDTWAWNQGLAKEDVLRAVSDNLYFDKQKDEKRFEILTDSAGKISILVNQRRNNRGAAKWESNDNKDWASSKEDKWSEGRGVATPQRASWQDEDWSNAGSWEQSSGSKEEAKVKEESWGDDSKEESWGDQSNDSWGDQSWDDWGKSRKNGESVQRWLGWALKSGYKGMSLPLKDGEWLWAESLAKELGKQKSQFGIHTVAELQSLLDDTDQAGRFEMQDGWIRKVKRDNRVSRAATATAAAAARHRSEEGSTPERPQRVDGSAWEHTEKEQRSNYPWSAPSTAQASSPARHNFSPPRNSSSVYEVTKEEPGNPQGGSDGKPGKPPGPGWSKFVDDGHFWWFYEGPLGKWWCQDLDKDVEPYEDDD